MFVLNQVIDEREEILYEFFERNLKQLQYYEDAFKNNKHEDESSIVKAIKLHIKEKYIPNYNKQYYQYNFIKNNINVRKLTKYLKIFKETNNSDFRKSLFEFVEKLNFFLYEDYLNYTICSKF
ncbi:210_t:CDS:1 [Scutellospora calospora]|uniref:210_t:CDS:1 n=1 Tax=Scutellospora calospora TaxID=85575 RepID=A0ACA9MS82_9GLOM|nr:210_t:CDS:1 [Scutellospora calospora]